MDICAEPILNGGVRGNIRTVMNVRTIRLSTRVISLSVANVQKPCAKVVQRITLFLAKHAEKLCVLNALRNTTALKYSTVIIGHS